jgi:putative transposase
VSAGHFEEPRGLAIAISVIPIDTKFVSHLPRVRLTRDQNPSPRLRPKPQSTPPSSRATPETWRSSCFSREGVRLTERHRLTGDRLAVEPGRAASAHLVLDRKARSDGDRHAPASLRFVSIFSAVRNLFVPPRSSRSAFTTHLHRLNAMVEWKSATTAIA